MLLPSGGERRQPPGSVADGRSEKADNEKSISEPSEHMRYTLNYQNRSDVGGSLPLSFAKSINNCIFVSITVCVLGLGRHGFSIPIEVRSGPALLGAPWPGGKPQVGLGMSASIASQQSPF